MKQSTKTDEVQDIVVEHYTPESRRRAHQQIERQVQEFLARGGKIKQLEAGMQSHQRDEWASFKITSRHEQSTTKPRKSSCSN